MQILFPDPMMRRIRELAEREDVSVSDFIRRAAWFWIDRYPEELPEKKLEIPIVDAGPCLLNSEEMKQALYE